MVWSQRRAWFVGLLVVASTLVVLLDDCKRQGCSATDDGAALTSGRDDRGGEDRSDPADTGHGTIARAEEGNGVEPDYDNEPTGIAIERCGGELTLGRCRGTCFAAATTVQREHLGRSLDRCATPPDRAGHGFRVPTGRGRRDHAVPSRGHRRLRGVRHQSSHDPDRGCRREPVGVPRRQRPHPGGERGTRRVHRAGRLRRRGRPVQRLLEDRDGGARLRPEHPLPPLPTVTVTPRTGLVHDQQVQVTGSGFPPNDFIQVDECAVDADVPCTFEFQGAPLVSDAGGNIDRSFTVKRVIGYPGQSFDCLERPGCVLRAASSVDSLAIAEVALAFDPNAPLPPPPVLEIAPSSNLAHDQEVTVRGSGFSENAPVQLQECAERGGVQLQCTYGTGFGPTTDATGSFEATFRVKRAFGFPGEPITDCLDVDGCALYASTFDDPLSSAEVALDFDPDAPLPRPELSVVPSANLPAIQAVDVTGSGFAASTFHNVVQCTRESTFFNFTCIFGPTVTSGPDGSIALQTTVERYIPAFPAPIDCAEPDRCMLAVFSYDDGLSWAFAPIGFDPAAPPPPPPALTVTPSTGLADGDVVTITGSGFSPGAGVGVSQCRDGSIGGADCDFAVAKFPNADGSGGFSIEYTVAEQISAGAAGPLDCGSAAGVCAIGAVSNTRGREENAAIPLTFGAPPPSPVGGGGGPVPVRAATPRLALTGTPVAGYVEFGALSLRSRRTARRGIPPPSNGRALRLQARALTPVASCPTGSHS